VPSAGGILDALRSRNVVVLCVQYLVWSIGVYGFVFWLPTIVKSLSGRGIGSTGLLSAIPYAMAAILMIANSHVSDRTNKPRRLFVWPFLLIAAIAFYLSYLVGTGHGGTSHFLVSFILLVIAGGVMNAPYGPYFASVAELLPQEVSGAAMGAINALGAVGGFTGTYIVGALGGGTKSGAAFIFLAAALLAAALLMFAVRQPRTSESPSPSASPLAVSRRATSARA
jgi:nitrate/nitrite transporter NarK